MPKQWLVDDFYVSLGISIIKCDKAGNSLHNFILLPCGTIICFNEFKDSNSLCLSSSSFSKKLSPNKESSKPLIISIESGRYIYSKEPQPKKHASPMLLTELGIRMFTRDLQTSVFASLFLSAIYILNGRKVVTWIL